MKTISCVIIVRIHEISGLVNPHEIISYWYSDRIRSHWLSSTPELDLEILEKYEQVLEHAVGGRLDDWRNTSLGCLALVLIFDQFPLNMFRGNAKSFQTERDAIEVAKEAILNGFIAELNQDQLQFLFMPLMHSEQLKEQDLAVELYRSNGLVENIRFAEHQRGIIAKFGRFPHRNDILGRESTLDEIAYLESDNAFKG